MSWFSEMDTRWPASNTFQGFPVVPDLRSCTMLSTLPLLYIAQSVNSDDRHARFQGLQVIHGRPKLITWTRTWLLLASGVVLQTVIYKGLYGIDRFFLKEIKNVMFLNKIDVPYCLVVFFVVCPRLRPFWSVFGELALFWCSTAGRTVIPGVSVARGA